MLKVASTERCPLQLPPALLTFNDHLWPVAVAALVP